MSTNQWTTCDESSNTLFATNSILNQALPGSLAAPSGWHSELVQSSSSSIYNNIETDLFNNSTSSIDKYEEYKTLNTTDGPPMIFSSTSETSRILNEIPSSTTHIDTSNINEFNTTSIDDCVPYKQKTILTEEQRNTLTNIETQQSPPVVVHKKASTNPVRYQQKISVRYLQPPTPPPPGPIIIREIRRPPPPAHSPIQIRQRPPCAPTPPTLIFRERPPPRPPRPASRVIERLLPPPPRPPRRLIVERLGDCPPKPCDVVIERWLPYRRSDQRRILYERAPAPYIPPSEPNLLVLHDQRHARIHKEFINQGVTRADPQYYLQQFGAELNSSHIHSQFAHIIDEAVRTLPPPPPILNHHNSFSNTNHHPPSPLLASMWERMKSASPSPHLPSYNHNYPSYGYSGQYPHDNHPNSYNNHTSYMGANSPITGVTSPWPHSSYSSSPPPHLPSYQFSPLPNSPRTIQVKSDQEFHHVLSDLTNGRIPTPLRSY